MFRAIDDLSNDCDEAATHNEFSHLRLPPVPKAQFLESLASRLRRLVTWDASKVIDRRKQAGFSPPAYRFASRCGLVGIECRVIMHQLKTTSRATGKEAEL